MRPEVLTPDTDWPPAGDDPTVLLVESAGPDDRLILDRWLSTQPLGIEETRVARSAAEAVRLATGDDAWIAPLRVAWLPPGNDGDRRWRLRELAAMRTRGGLSARARERILAAEPDRCRILVGQPARLSALRDRMAKRRKTPDPARLDAFVEHQARLTLD
ncbi:MAG: glycerol-3-phosphate O-acyltransferase, partial [Solirubrobacteraceae bacterium]|nr:glycerol-3-phosphate O-acyltransferase [Solirubrobacteraceae bacterium]